MTNNSEIKERLTTSVDTSVKITSLGIKVDTMLSYYKEKNGFIIDFTDKERDTYYCPAYTSEELLNLLPDSLDFEEGAFTIDEKNGKITLKKDKETLSEPLILLEFNTSGGIYISRYTYNGCAVSYKGEALLILEEGKESESRAKLLMKLFKNSLVKL